MVMLNVVAALLGALITIPVVNLLLRKWDDYQWKRILRDVKRDIDEKYAEDKGE